MSRGSEPRYRAFLSYSHLDSEYCSGLHKRLEQFRLPRELKEHRWAPQPMPETLHPIFRDRSDAPAGDARIREALDASETLIVICSPNAAKSREVDEEIRIFKALGRKGRIFPIIISGVPGDHSEECFPSALRFEVDEHGVLTGAADRPPLAGDVRPEGDGRWMAELKVIAGVIGVSLDAILRRDIEERRKRMRRLAAIATTMTVSFGGAVLAGGAALYYAGALKSTNEQLESSNKMLERTIAERDDTNRKLSHSVISEQAAARRAEQNLSLAEDRLGNVIDTALEFINSAGALAESFGIRNEAVGRLLAPADKALEAELGRAAGVSNPRLLNSLAMTNLVAAQNLRRAGHREEWWQKANAVLERLRAHNASFPQSRFLQRGLVQALIEVGETYREKGDHTSALSHFEEALAISERLGRIDDEKQLLRDVAFANYSIAEIKRLNGNSEEALRLYSRAVDIRRALIAGGDGTLDIELDLSMTHVGIAETHHAGNDLLKALEHFQIARQIRERLLEQHGHDLRVKRLLSWVLSFEADTMQELPEKRTMARTNLERAIKLRRELVASHPEVPVYQRDLAWGHWSMAEAERKRGHMPDAIAEAREALRRFTELFDRDRRDTRAQRNVGRGEVRLGSILVEAGQVDEGMEHLEAGRKLIQIAIDVDPGNLHWRWDLAIAMSGQGYGYAKQGQCETAVMFYGAARKQLEFMLHQNPRHVPALDVMSELQRREKEECQLAGAAGRPKAMSEARPR